VEEEAVLEELNEDVFVVPIFYEDLTEMVFSPLDTHGSQLVSLTMVLEVDRDVVLEEITKKRARIWDMALQELEGRTVAELRDPDKEAIREAVMNTINEELQNGAVTGIYITDFIMQ
jgi:flagellar basal body-associated protein FliL